jgi:hypothetical protein
MGTDGSTVRAGTSKGATVSDATDGLMKELEERWDELEPRSGTAGEEERDSPKAGSPRATTLSGETDSASGD